MKEYTSQHGFEFIRARECHEQAATLVEFRHIGTHAPLYFFDRADANMTFAIGFRTLPTDDTGVFHILEHSVLCGSEKYPVKDPFSELLKGSISTYLNAFTYGEKTVYPVSSMNKRAFLNLVSVYLDAVLHPLASKNEFIFRQEGHRLELSEDGTRLERNGIVYNEMKGAYSSPDELMAYYEGLLLYEGGCYGFDSGGKPDAIPSLTYEQFCEAHARYYHPTNSVLFLDGEVELDEVLALIDSYLSGYGVGECFTEIPGGRMMSNRTLEVGYPVSSEDEEKDEARICLLWQIGTHESKTQMQALSLVIEALTDGNGAPLKKRVIDSGLCKNFHLGLSTGMKYTSLNAKFTGVKDGCEEELVALFKRAVGEVIAEGIDREAILAALNATEFATREADFGSYPCGMVYMGSIIEDAVFGEDPITSLRYNELFTFLREKIDTPYYIELLRGVLSREPDATLILHPDATLTERTEAGERAELDALFERLTDEEKCEIATQGRAFAEWQASEESEEALASIPTLSLSDLADPTDPVKTVESEREGVRILRHDIDTRGITYLDLLFEITDADPEMLTLISFLPAMIIDLDTEEHTAMQMRQIIKARLGSFTCTMLHAKKDGEPHIYFEICASLLDSEKAGRMKLIEECIYKRKFEDAEIVKLRASQLYTRLRDGLTGGAVNACIQRGAAAFDRFEASKNLVSPLTRYAFLKELFESGDYAGMLTAFDSFVKEYLTRERLTVVLTGKEDDALIDEAIAITPTGGSKVGECKIPLGGREPLGIAITSGVSYATAITNLQTEAGCESDGSFNTLGTLLDYELLWNEIRVKGGAYGTGFICRGNSGTLGYYSYRDPSPERSVEVYRGMTGIVRDFLSEEADLTKYIIGTVGGMDSVSTPRLNGSTATLSILSGKTQEDLNRIRRECIATSREDLERDCDLIDKAMESAVITVAGPKDRLVAMGIESIIEI